MTQSMTVNGVLRVRKSGRKQRPNRKALDQAEANRRHPTKRSKKSNADLIQEGSR